MPIDFVEESASKIDFVPDDQQPTRDIGAEREDLRRQMREARAEAYGNKAILGLADLGERAAYTASLMDPLTAVGRVINPRQQSAIPAEAAQAAIEFLDPFGNAPVGSAREGAKQFAAEMVSGLAQPEAAAAMMAGKINPQLPGRLFQPGLIKGSQQAAANLAQAETPSEAMKSGLELGLALGGTAGIEAHGAKAGKAKPTDLTEAKPEVTEAKPAAEEPAPKPTEIIAEPAKPAEPAPVEAAAPVAAEKIVSTAWKMDDGSIITGKTPNRIHSLILDDFEKTSKEGENRAAVESGFVTSTGRFVNADEAAVISGTGLKKLGAEHLTKTGNISLKNVELQKQFDAEDAAKSTPPPPSPEAQSKPAAAPTEVKTEIKAKQPWEMTAEEAAQVTGLTWDKWQDSVSTATKEGKLTEDSTSYKSAAKTGNRDFAKLKNEAQKQPPQPSAGIESGVSPIGTEASKLPSLGKQSPALSGAETVNRPGNLTSPPLNKPAAEGANLIGGTSRPSPAVPAVERAVAANVHDLKILDPVVSLVPVDVVDMLGGKEATAKVLLNNPSVFTYTLSINRDPSVQVRIASELRSAIAKARAELPASSDLRLPSGELRSALGTLDDSLVGFLNRHKERLTQQESKPQAQKQGAEGKKQRKLLPAEQAFFDAHGMTVKQALESNLIVANKRIDRFGKDKLESYSPASSDSYQFRSALEAANKEKEIRAAKKATADPDRELREQIWSKMTDQERRSVRQNPKVFEKDEGALDWEFLQPYADKYGIKKPTPGPGAQTVGEPKYAAIAQLTDQLNAAPPLGAKEKLAWREKIADVWASGKSSLEKAFAKAEAIKTSLRDTARGVRSITDLDRHIASLDYLLQRSSGQSRESGHAIERAVPNKPMREAIAIWIDSGGDVAAIQSVLDNLPKGIRPNVRRALKQAVNLPQEAKGIASQFQQFFGIREQDAVQSDIFEKGLEDYFTHIWEKPENMPDKLRTAISNGKVNDYFQFARQRKIPTFLEGIAEGKNPVLDPAKVMPFYNYALDRTIASREFIKGLSDLTAPDGRPAVLPNGIAVPVEKGGTPEALIINPKGKTEMGKDYRVIDHPAMRKWKWIGTDENGNPILYRSDLAVNPLMYERLSRMLDRGRMTPTEWGRRALRVSSEVKAIKLAAFPSLFHQVHVGSHALWHWTNPFKTSEINWDAPETKFAIEKGHLKLAPDASELANFSEGVLGPGLIHKVPGIGPISKAYSEWLFGDWIPRLKIKTFENAYQRNLKWYAKDIAKGKVTPEEIASRVGDSINNAYGELNHLFLGKYGRDPRFQRLLRGIFLAPDFGEARLRFTEKAFTKMGHEERLAFATMVITMYIAARVGNMVSHGNPEWDWKKAFSVKAGKHWYTMRSVAGDLLHAMSNAGQFMYVRLNPLYSRTVSDFLFQRDPQGRKLTWDQMLLKRPAEQLIPINFSNLTRDDQTLWESFITSMGAQSRHDVPSFEISKLMRDYMKASPDPKLRAQVERSEQEIFAPSDYKGIRLALKNGDLDEARSEYRKLTTEKGKKLKDIQQTLSPYTAGQQSKPYGGLSQTEWTRFKRILKPSDLVILKDAEAERKLIYDNFVRMQHGQR